MAKKKSEIGVLHVLGAGKYRVNSKGLTPPNESSECVIGEIIEEFDEKANHYVYIVKDTEKRILIKIKNCPVIVYYNV